MTTTLLTGKGTCLRWLKPAIGVIVVMLCLHADLSANHIVGADISYTCLGNNRYRFVMNIYKEGIGPPTPGTNTADFDQPAYITIYQGNETQIFRSLTVQYISRTPVPVTLGNPCLITNVNVQVEQAVYVWEETLPFHAQGYHIMYQRCCRNNTINNIFIPGNTGATYSLFMSGASMVNKPNGQCGNNSPVFNDFPPIAICTNEPVNFDHSATDADGDEIVYSFCAAFAGATVTQPMPTISPPPSQLNQVNYIGPTYTDQFPLGVNAPTPVTIDPVTGLIDGIPNIPGQFVVSVCIEEFRDGVLMTRTYRDFQFNVTHCLVGVRAGLAADYIEFDPVVNDNVYVFKSCGEFNVYLENVSPQLSQTPNAISKYSWQFDIQGNVVEQNSFNGSFQFPEGVFTTYRGMLIINPDEDACTDTAHIRVDIYPEVVAAFEPDYEPCEIGPVTFTDLSYTGADEIISFSWSFGDGTQEEYTESVNPIHEYGNSGSYPVSLHVIDNNECEDTVTELLQYYPTSIINIVPDSFRICHPGTVQFANNSYPIDGYTTIWDFGDGQQSFEASPQHVYQHPGNYSITIQILSPIGCDTSATFHNWIEILQSPIAGFSYTPDNPSNFNSTVTFKDESALAHFFQWDFGGVYTSTSREPVITFQDTGVYYVEQIVKHINGCTDTAYALVDVEPKYTFYLPNAFSPNYDDINDLYGGVGIFFGLENFQLSIYNRWGERIFHTNNPEERWNGRKHNSGEHVKNGVYVCHVSFRAPRGGLQQFKTFVMVVR